MRLRDKYNLKKCNDLDAMVKKFIKDYKLAPEPKKEVKKNA